MDVKDLRTDSGLSERNNDGSKYTQGGGALSCNRNKSYQDIGSNPLAKTEPTPVRPCAVIGPDRVVPPPASNDAFLKKVSIDPWLSTDNLYRRPPEYPLKATINQNPSRNISPRQTFQENMQRIMVPSNYNAVKHGDDVNYNSIQDRNLAISKNVKPNMAPEAKYCDVPYTINTLTNEPKSIREGEMYVSNVHSPLTRTAPSVWPPGSVNVHAPRTFGAHEMYQYSQYQSCAGPRPTVIPVNRPTRTIQEDPGYQYPEHYYQDPSIRFKPYPPVKERYPQPRYEYIGNYPPIGTFHVPSPIQTHKYDISKSGQPHPYSVYPHLKYVDNRMTDHSMEGYQRPTNQQAHFNIPFRNQVIHPSYAPVVGNISQSKMHPYPPDTSAKVVHPNKLPFDNSNKMYIEYENSRNKSYPISDNYFVNEMSRGRPVKNQMIIPNYSCITMPPTPHQHYRKDSNSQIRPYEYVHYRNLDPSINNNIMRHPSQFSPNTLAISPTDSIASNDTAHTLGTSQEDCGYVSQSSTASVRSIDSGMYKQQSEYYKHYDYRYSPVVGSSPTIPKSDSNANDNKHKQINVRQFFQMWNEGEDDNCESSSPKEIVMQGNSSDLKKIQQQKQYATNQDQLYVLGLVNVPSEELSKYEHIQKISKLPENIKGYNNLELLNQFEEAIESTNTSGYKANSKEFQITSKENTSKQLVEALPRPVSPLDVEAKISQSVIHKEVGCNFEIRPCSPQMLNVEVAAPAQNILGERIIEKVTNPLSKLTKSPIPDENSKSKNLKRQEKTFTITDNPSCKMIGSPYVTSNMDSIKTNYLQDLEINSGVCLASLPRLDNEIELSFPEVNQQFINASKKDVSSPPNPRSQGKLEESSYNSPLDGTDITKYENAPTHDESEKSFTKLIKYRKNKSVPVCVPDIEQSTKAVRTDSVIIKNPDNIKNIEDKFLESGLCIPMNLSSQAVNSHKPDFELPDKPNNNSRDTVALDFSLNKSINNGLPIIDIGNDVLTKSPLTKDISYENLISNSMNQDNKNTNNFTNKIFEIEADDEPLVKNSQDTKKYISETIHDDLTKSDVKNDDLTSILDNAYSQNFIAENARLENSRLYDSGDTDNSISNADEEMSEVAQSCSVGENMAFINQNDDTLKENNLLNDNIPTGQDDLEKTQLLVSSTKYEEPANDCQNILTSENKKVDYTNKTLIDETDEISATLEKIFEETSDNVNNFENKSQLNVDSLLRQNKANYSYQSKELYSPWIQKLLLNNEGLCSLTGTLNDKGSSKHTYQDVELIDEPKPIKSDEVNSQDIKLEESIENTDASMQLTLTKTVIDDRLSDALVSNVHCPNLCLLDNIDSPNMDNNKNTSIVKHEIISEENCISKSNIAQNMDKINDLSRVTATESEFKTNDHQYDLKNEIYASEDTSLNSKNLTDKKIYIDNVNIVEAKQCSDTKEITDSEDLLSVCPIETVPSSNVENISKNATLLNTQANKEESISKLVNIEPESTKTDDLCENTCTRGLNSSRTDEVLIKDDVQSEIHRNIEFIVKNKLSSHDSESLSNNVEEVDTFNEYHNIIVCESANVTQESTSSSENILRNDITMSKLENEKDLISYTDKSTNDNSAEEIANYEKYDPIKEDSKSNLEVDNVKVENELAHNISDESTDNLKVTDILHSENKTEMDSPILSPLPNCDNVEKSNTLQASDHVQSHSKEFQGGNFSDQSQEGYLTKTRILKRSYSDSDLNNCRKTDTSIKQNIESTPLAWSSKRQRIYELENSDQNVIAEKLCSFINNNRRNSVSAFYNEEDVSFCILIDNNCIVSEEVEDHKFCFAEIEDDCISEINVMSETNENEPLNISNDEKRVEADFEEENELNFSEAVILDYEKSNQDSWLDDVACVETVVSDDITEEVICSSSSSPKDISETVYDISENSNSVINESMIEEGILEHVCEHESHHDDNMPYYELDSFEDRNVLYRDQCLERILSDSNSRENSPTPILHDPEVSFSPVIPEDTDRVIPDDKENIFVNIPLQNDDCYNGHNSVFSDENHGDDGFNPSKTSCNMHTTENVVQSCESSIDNVFSYKQKDEDGNYSTSSSPEVSSTTSEEKSSSILLKITNYNGSRISQVNEYNSNRPRCKFTEKKEYSNGGLNNRPLLTKAAQKYIPPLKESIRDLKVQLSLPQQKLLKLKQLKLSKNEPKINKNNSFSAISKKPKPNFEDVLKSIDEVQIKMHKEKSKKGKPVPKVVIKKSLNGSHYTSSSQRDAFNPDLTGRKWQPWVFLEKNHFIDKMVIRNKTKAIFSHRQNTYVLAEKFKKYKSISSAKFVITHPNAGDSSKGQLKYTIRLKHTY